MDSITQIALGASLGETILRPKVGRKALAWGAFLGTLPDLDIFIPMGGPVDEFVYHRGFSHSLLLLAILSPLIAWFITIIHPQTKEHFSGWFFLSFVILEASALLDFFTIYGTQIFWPFSTTPLAWSVFFIIDPLFTLPIVLGLFFALFMNRKPTLGHRFNNFCLAISFIYLLWAFGVKAYMEYTVKEQLNKHDVEYTQLVSSPAPFTTFLYRFVGIQGDLYFETYASLFDGEEPLLINYYPRNSLLAQELQHHPPVKKLAWFTRGYFAMSLEGDAIVMTDLRMGSEPNYVFRFKVAKRENLSLKPIEPEQLPAKQDWDQLKWVWDRIWRFQPVTK